MKKFQNSEVIPNNPELHVRIAIDNPEHVPVEAMKRIQLFVMAKQFLFYSAFFEFLDRYFVKLPVNRDVEKGDVMETPARRSLCRLIYNAEKKTLFGKKAEEWVDFGVWIGLVTSILVFAGAVMYLLSKNNQTGQCPNISLLPDDLGKYSV